MDLTEFLNGSCAALAKAFHRNCGCEIFHVVRIEKTEVHFDGDEGVGSEDGIIHTLVKLDKDKYLDASGISTAAEVIHQWYEETDTIAQDTEIFLVDDALQSRIFLLQKKLYQLPISKLDLLGYQLEKHRAAVNYSYTGDYVLVDVCEQLLKLHS